MPRPLSRASSILLAVALCAVGALVLIGFLHLAAEFGRQEFSDATETAERRAEGIAAAVEQFTSRALDEGRTLHLLAQRWADGGAPGSRISQADVEETIRLLLQKRGLSIEYAIILGADGGIAWATIPTAAENATDRDYFQRHRDTGVAEFVGTPLIGRSSGKLVVPMTARLATLEGDFAGVAYTPLNVAALSAALATLVSRPADVAAVYRLEGDLVARSVDAELLVGRRRLTAIVMGHLGAGNEATFHAISPVTGRATIGHVRRIGDSNLLVLATIDIEDATAEARRSDVLARVAAVVAWLVLIAVALGIRVAVRFRGRKREAAARLAGREEVERLLAALPAVLFVRTVEADGGGEQLYRNGNGVSVSGWAAGTFPHERAWADYAVPGTDFTALARRAVDEGQATMDWQLRQPGGGYAWMRSTVQRLERRPDGTWLIVGYILNVTAERDAEARAMTAARLASLGEMGAGIAHELKQPLTVIMLAGANAQAAIRRGEGEKAQARLQRMIDLAQRAALIIDHLRRFARGDGSGAAAGPIDVTTTVGNALQLLGGSLQEAQITVRTDLPAPALVALGHPLALEQVLVNLIGNARDAVSGLSPGPDRCIAIAGWPVSPQQVRITVSDNGGGIPGDMLARLFEPFVTTKGPDRGTGLGLSVSRGLIAAMGGAITAANAGEGACLTITLPAAPQAAT